MTKYYVTIIYTYEYSYIIDNIEILKKTRNQCMNLGNCYIRHTNYIGCTHKKI